jgi:hypothetical protein
VTSRACRFEGPKSRCPVDGYPVKRVGRLVLRVAQEVCGGVASGPSFTLASPFFGLMLRVSGRDLLISLCRECRTAFRKGLYFIVITVTLAVPLGF